jgi:uncharacterized glyoxalase superfamily protein PhnB
MPVRPIPEGYHAVTPYLLVSDTARLIEFLQQTFDAEVTECMTMPDGSIMHAEARIRDSKVMMGLAHGERKPVPAMLYVYVEDCDAVYRRAVHAGGTTIMEPADQFYGDRTAAVQDPTGNYWWFATHKEDLSHEEIIRRHEAAMREGKP